MIVHFSTSCGKRPILGPAGLSTGQSGVKSVRRYKKLPTPSKPPRGAVKQLNGPAPYATVPDVFTGLVQDVGRLQRFDRTGAGARLTIETALETGDFELGESIAVSGACLTVVSISGGSFAADASPETLSRTRLGRLKIGSEVNLERALRLGDRLGGHIVQGHVDGVGKITELRDQGEFSILGISSPSELAPHLVPKGSVAIDGISLTINEVRDAAITLTVIPHTLKATALRNAGPGDEANLETDILGKYVERLLLHGRLGRTGEKGEGGIDEEFLARKGFL